VGWGEVYAYSFAGEIHHLGDWPGIIATQDGSSLWYYIDVEVDTDVDSFKIIFNNGLGMQSGEVTIDDDINVYVSMLLEVKYSSKAAIESLIQPDETTTIWFYNSLGWDNVYAYVWGIYNEILGEWPGSMAIQDSDPDWWSITLPFDTAKLAINIQFSNFDDAQTPGVTLDFSGPHFITSTGDYYTSKEEAEASLNSTTRIFFYNSNNWTNVYAYEHYGSLGAWPGAQAAKELDNNWWYVDVLGDLNYQSYVIKFHNNEIGSDFRETDNVIINSSSGVFVTVNSTAFQTSAEAEYSILPTIMTQVWFYNSNGWDNVYAYAFNIYGTYFGKFPGAVAYQEIDSDWWVIGVPLDVQESDFLIIFSDGESLQTPDVIITESTGLYITVDGQIHISKALAEEHMAVYTRIYFLNSNEWQTVYAYENNHLLGEWPGIVAEKEVDSDWWYVDVPGDIADTTYIMKFHNADPLLRETFLATVDASSGVYMTVNSAVFTNKESAEATVYPENMTTVYFLNSENWSEVNAFVFIETDNYLGKYPGKLAVKEELSDWWSVEVPLDINLTDFYIVFSEGDFVNKTPDTLITSSDNLYVTVDGSVHESKTLAEEHVLVYTRIYFYNYNEWASVWAYEEHNLLGGWPGVVAEKEVDSDWWYVDVIGDINEVEFLIKFHNNEPILRQTTVLTINSLSGVYTTVNSTIHDTKEEVENFFNPAVTTTVYFLNTEGWSEVSAYAYFDSTEYIGNWPGKLATKESEFSDWWTIEVPLDIIMAEVNIVFSDGTNAYQTSDIIINGMSGLYVLPNGVTYQTKGDAEYNAYPLTTVYFYNDLGWVNVYAYAFIEGTEYLGSWPGTVALKEVDSDWWTIDVPLNVEPGSFTILFNDGIDQQTPNIVIDTLTGIYVVSDGNIFTSAEEAEDYLNPSTTVYFYNSDDWAEVWVEAEGTYDDDPSFWLSTQATRIDLGDWWFV
ncbi:MAG: starch-binding protein, partial [Candidatus Izemoplasmatales bacterium]|nr:starch-binding protein [Candidatus Izemoplasmatales bacterium]